MGLRLMVYDRNSSAGRFLVSSWKCGGKLYRALGRLDAWYGAGTWAEALKWLASHRAPEPIEEVQFWGHGKWGDARIGTTILDASLVSPSHPQHPDLLAVRTRLIPGSGLWWFRTCSTFGAAKGQAFARAWASFLGCRAAGHTFIIGLHQSGLHSLGPNETPAWPIDEGVAGEVPLWSKPWAPNTITCFHGKVPAGY
jgi:hypothetical protein